MKKFILCSQVNFLQLSRVLLTLLLAMLVTAAGLFFALQAQATFNDDFRVHTWGMGGLGALGLGELSIPAGHPNWVPVGQANRNAPVEVPDIAGISDWRDISADGGRTFAITQDGRLFGWGENGAGTLGIDALGNTPIATEATNLPAGVTAFTRIDGGSLHAIALDQRNYLFGAGSNVNGQLGLGDAVTNSSIFVSIPKPEGVTSWRDIAAGSVHTLALDQNGRLFAFGTNTAAQLGIERPDGALNHFVRTPTLVPFPNVIPPVTEWRSVSAGGQVSAAISSDGRLFTWGQGIPTGAGTHVPNEVLLPNYDWERVEIGADFTTRHALALTTCGRLFSWGINANGVTGLDTSVGNTYVPTQIGNQSNWTYIATGNNASAALDNQGRLFTWGNNAQGQLGLGDNTHRFVPTRVGDYYWDAISVGDHHMIAISSPPLQDEFYLIKELNKPYGTPRPTPISFDFTMVARSFNDNSAANFTDNFPANSTNLVRTVTIGNTSASVPASPQAGDVVTLSDSTNLLAGIDFTRTGIFAWTIQEVLGSSQTTAPSNVVYSQAVYELRVYVAQQPGQLGEFYARYITLIRHTNADGTIPPEPVKIDDDSLTFVNRYTRVTEGAAEHFEIRKTVTGEFASSNETFTFEITLTRTGLCPENRTFIGRVVDLAGNPVSPPRTYTFTTGVTQNVVLGHNQRLIFDGANAITLGSTFLVVEQACPFHIASVRVYSYNTAQPPAPYFVVHTNTAPDQPRTTNIHMIGANRNAALFTNTHEMPPPTGLFLTSGSPYLVLLAAGLLTTAYFSLRARKRIEELPIMH